MKYDYDFIQSELKTGKTLKQIAEEQGWKYSSLRVAVSRYRRNATMKSATVTQGVTCNIARHNSFANFVSWLQRNKHKPFAEMLYDRIETTKKDRAIVQSVFELLKEEA